MSKQNLTRRQFITTTVGATGLTLAGCVTGNSILTNVSGADSDVATLRIAKPSHLTILQFTDVHFFWGKPRPVEPLNQKTEEAMKTLVALTKPDMVIITGDLWRDNPDEKLEEYMHYTVAKCAELGVPWAFTWGNHDKLIDYKVGHKALAEAKNSLYHGGESDGNYRIDLVDKHHKTVCQLVCLNSKGDGLGASQHQWMLDQAGKIGKSSVPRLAFFHIPFKEYGEVWNNGTATGVVGEEPSCEKQDGATMVCMKALGVKACFCGHDHVNDYGGKIDGIEMVFGRATGYGGYGDEVLSKGGKLITVNCLTGQYDWTSVLPDGTHWKPEPGERINKIPKK